jgi:hypothetical protein
MRKRQIASSGNRPWAAAFGRLTRIGRKITEECGIQNKQLQTRQQELRSGDESEIRFNTLFDRRHTHKSGRHTLVLLLAAAAISAFSLSPVRAQEISVQAAVEKQQVFVGESFLFQIQVEGDSSPAEPDLSSLSDFHVQPRGGQQNNSESITIINGKMERVAHRGYVFNYSLTPKKAGVLTVPAIAVVVDNKTFQTAPIRISVSEPAETDDFKLRLTLPKKEMYVGEPVELTVTWYVGKDVEGFEFSYPLVDDPRFKVAVLDVPAVNQQNAIKIALGNKTVIGKKGQGVLEGKQFMTVSFKHILIPRKTGSFTLPQATVAAQALVGYQQRQVRDPFADFFDRDFFGRRRGVYKTVITPSNEVEIEVLPLPSKGRPARYSGLVGEYSMVAQATPTEVSVGDPITLEVMVTGPDYLENVELPTLQAQGPLARDFKIPEEMAAGELRGRMKVFTQTIRARNAAVKAVPSISLTYFNPATGSYETATTDPIPLAVRTARVVTARDAEGQQAAETGKEVTVFNKGIAYNYEDAAVLENQERAMLWLVSDRGYSFLLALPGMYLLLFAALIAARRQRRNPAEQQARKAHRELVKNLKSISKRDGANIGRGYLLLGEALRRYLGDKLQLSAAALTYLDVAEHLQSRGVSKENMAVLKHILDQCEAHRFAGADFDRADLDRLIAKGLDLATQLERSLK